MARADASQRAQRRYRDAAVAEAYDSWRYETPRGRRRNRRDLDAIRRAFSEAARRGLPVGSALDIPCGTGRLATPLRELGADFVGEDISMEMMRVARRKTGVSRWVQSRAEALPHRDETFDAVLAIRFLFHVPDRDERRRVLIELARVSRRWLVLDVRHRHNLRYLGWRLRHGLGLLPEIQFRFSRPQLLEELAEAGLGLVGIYPSRRRFGWLSDKWMVLAEKTVRTSGTDTRR
jgi:ubiquinone/menaquinone biosynthesis C-methylase UbiE